jgi:class 3 adenylate cyclase/pimeloyl-ACP methyl ester carboxylesterase
VADGPITRYARTSDGGNVAYQVFGDGPVDLLVLHGITVPTDLLWEDPGLARTRDRLSAFSRCIWIELRGWGSSDRDLPVRRSLDDFVESEQLTAVFDAVGCERVAIVALSGPGPSAIRYAATHPERVDALVLCGTFASYVRDEECPWGMPIEALERLTRLADEGWGTGSMVEALAPSRAGDVRFREWAARGERLGHNPAYAAQRIRGRMAGDVRALLPGLRMPTLVVHRRDDKYIRVEAGRYLAEKIEGAKYVELPGQDNWFFVGDSDAIIDEIEEFLTGARSGTEGDVVVSTVLFTDIVDSTRQQATVGHRQWSKLSAEHDAVVRAAIGRHRGHEIKTTGDGYLITFDSASRAMRCATEIVTRSQQAGLAVRAGIHTGELEFRGGDISGLAVSIGKRVCDRASGGQVVVTETVRGAAIGSNLEFDSAGEHSLKGIPGSWHLYAVRT